MKEGLDGGKSCGTNRMGEESERGGSLWLVVGGGLGVRGYYQLCRGGLGGVGLGGWMLSISLSPSMIFNQWEE